MVRYIELYGGRYLSWLRWRCCVIRGLIFEEDGWFWYNLRNEKEFKEQEEKAIVWYGVGRNLRSFLGGIPYEQ